MSFYRQAAFVTNGLLNFTQGAFQKRQAEFNPQALTVDLKGKNFMITGANSGLGKSVALELLKRGGTVHMVCRNKERAEKAREELVQASGNNEAYLHIVDISNIRQVKSFARSYVASGLPLNVLVNNAGAMLLERSETPEKIDASFATNVLGPFILEDELRPALQKAAPARVITVSSGGMLTQDLNADDPQLVNQKYDGMWSYAQNKRAEVCLTEKLAEEEKEGQIWYQSMHPGWADTPGVRDSMPDFYEKLKDKFRTAGEGADTVVWLSISEEAKKYSPGQFFLDRQPQSKHLPLAWSSYSKQDVDKVYKYCFDLAKPLEPKPEDLSTYSYLKQLSESLLKSKI